MLVIAIAFLATQLAVASATAVPAADARQNPYDKQLQTLIAQFDTAASGPEQSVLLNRACELRDYVDDRAALTAFVERVASRQSVHALVRDEAQRRLAEIDLHRGHLEDAERHYEQLGFVRHWAIVGPFPGGLTTSAGPDHGFRPGEKFMMGTQELAWRETVAPGPRMLIDLADYLPRAGSAVAFAATSVYAKQPGRAALRFTAESAFRLWVNGAEVASDGAAHGTAFDQHAVAVELHAGWNSILLKLAREGEGAWRFAVRVSGTEGGGIALASSTSQPATESSGATAAVEGAADLVSTAREALSQATSANAAARQFLLGEVERDHAAGNALGDLDAATRREPTAARWLTLAGATDNEAYRFAALSAAGALDGKNAAAKSELAAYYYSRGQLEKARDLLREALRLSPNDLVARKRLADVYAAADLSHAAMIEYAALAREFPQPIWLNRVLAPRYENAKLYDEAARLARAALAENVDGAEERATLARLLERSGDVAGLKRVYAEAAAIDPAYVVPLERLAAIATGEGDAHAAESQLHRGLAIAPSSAELHRELGEVLARAHRDADARQEFASAADLNPEEAGLRARLDGRRASDSRDDRDGEYMVDAAELAAATRKQPPSDAAPAVALADIRVERMFANGLTSVQVQQVYYVGSDGGAREFSTRALQYAPGTHNLQLLRARLFKRDGRVVEGEDGGESAVSDPGIAMYYDVRARTVRFRNVEKGDVVEIRYRVTPYAAANPYGDYFGELMVFRSELPTRLKRWVLITPTSRQLTIGEERMRAPAVVTVRAAERTYRWEAHDLEALSAEPRGPAASEVSPYVHVSTFSSWQELGRWYAQLIAPQFALDASLRDALQQLLAGKHSDLEKIRAIDHFVLRNTHYVALEFGIYGYKPYPVSETFARRYGDCKDKASLMIALLRAAGIPAEIALVRTRSMGELSDPAASIAIFNHAIVYLPVQQMWLDATAEYAGSQELPLEDQGGEALTVSVDGRAELRRIPVSTALDNFSRRVVTAQITGDGTVKFTGTSSTRGEEAPGLRRSYEVPEQQRNALAARLADAVPALKVDDVNVDNDLEHAVDVKFTGRLDSFKGKHALSLPASWLPRAWVQTLAPLTTRSEELRLGAPWTNEEEMRFELPSGAIVTALPRDRTVETRFGSARLHFEQHGREVRVESSVQFRQLRISPQDYADFRAFCDAIERAFRAEVRVSLAG